MQIPCVHEINQMQQRTAQIKQAGGTLSLVPTMGALHSGHETLIRHAAQLASEVAVSIFVNPLQFGPTEDFTRYPRDLDRDIEIAQRAGATCIFAPAADHIIPSGLTFAVDPGPMANILCGAYRPGHFRGVATIVLKLLNIVQPNSAVFGWKDAQQFIILRKMTKDLNVPVHLEAIETIREPDGLALSSRNAYLTPDQRRHAPLLYAALSSAHTLLTPPPSPISSTSPPLSTSSTASTQSTPSTTPENLKSHIQTQLAPIPDLTIQYIETVRLDDLTPLTGPLPKGTEIMIAIAAYLGKTRLIDNIRLTV
jgi:pantoate--beta-alanine ligase